LSNKSLAPPLTPTGVAATSSKSAPGAPKSERADDALNRWRVAQGILDLINSSPLEWPLRIGVYGSWGSGKTTVLSFIEKMALEQGMKVTWFNPWAYDDARKMAQGLARAIEDAILKEGDFDRDKATARRALAKLYDVSKKAVGVSSIGRAISEAVEEMGVRSLLETRKEALTKSLRDKLGDKRLIVAIDDLDRADPKRLSGVFYILREVLDLPQCTFVFGLDPDIVAKGLGGVSEGWEDGAAFLEKIIDFPIWLTEPSSEVRWSMAKKEVKDSGVEIDLDALRDIFDLVPSNPRRMTQFLRGFWRLKSIASRHNSSELHWISILFCQLLQSEFPQFLPLLARTEHYQKWIAHGWIERASNKAPSKGKEEEKEGPFKEYIEEQKFTLDETRRFLTLLWGWRERCSMIVSEQIGSFVSLFERPPVLTQKEYEEFYSRYVKLPTAVTIGTYLDEHCAKIGCTRNEAFGALFDRAILSRLNTLGLAADDQLKDDTRKRIEDSKLELALIQDLALRMHGFSTSILGQESYSNLFHMVGKWVHFQNPADLYADIRKNEWNLLIDVTKVATSIYDDIYEMLKPWSPDFGMGGDRNKYWDPIIADIKSLIEPKLAERILERLKRPDGIVSIRGESKHYLEKYLLFRIESPIYSTYLKALAALEKDAHENKVIQLNFIEVVSFLAYGYSRGLSPLGRGSFAELIKNRDILGHYWRGATCSEMQFRMASSLTDCLKVFRKYHDKEALPCPAWIKEPEPEVSASPTGADQPAPE
jgi:hypothetical protein